MPNSAGTGTSGNGTTIRTNSQSLNEILTVGVLDPLDLALTVPFTWQQIRENGNSTYDQGGLNDISLALKWRFLKTGSTSLAIKPSITLPSGDHNRGLGNARPAYGATLISTAEFKPITVSANIGYTYQYYTNADKKIHRADLWNLSLAGTVEVMNGLQVATEVGTASNIHKASTDWPTFMTGGFIYSADREPGSVAGCQDRVDASRNRYQPAARRFLQIPVTASLHSTAHRRTMYSIGSAVLDLKCLDLMAKGDSTIHRLDARAKVLVTLVFILCVVSHNRYELTALFPFFIFPFVMISLAGLPPLFILKKIILICPFVLVVGIFNPFFDREILLQLGPLGISGGWISFASILTRSILTVGAAFILVGVTGFTAVCQALERLGHAAGLYGAAAVSLPLHLRTYRGIGPCFTGPGTAFLREKRVGNTQLRLPDGPSAAAHLAKGGAYPHRPCCPAVLPESFMCSGSRALAHLKSSLYSAGQLSLSFCACRTFHTSGVVMVTP